MSNEWFERGELPPAGVKCEMTHPGIYMHGWQKVTVETIFTDTGGCKRAVISNCSDAIWEERMPVIRVDSDLKFRPIRTEREKAINAAKAALIKTGSLIAASYLAELYDAGLLRLPEDK